MRRGQAKTGRSHRSSVPKVFVGVKGGDDAPESTWEHHHDLQERLIGLQSPIWNSEPGLALSLWSTYPSGYPVIVDLRQQLASVMTGAPWEFRAWKPVQIRHLGALDRAVPTNEVFVGRELDTYNHSPWAPPVFVFPGAGLESYEQYISAQADKSEFLSHLVGKTIVCDCELRGAAGHAQVLKEWSQNLC